MVRQWTFSPAAQAGCSRAESRRFVPKMETGASGIYDSHGKNPNVMQVAIILNCAGPEFIRVFMVISSGLVTATRNGQINFSIISRASKGNVVVYAYRFWNVRWKEPFDAYLTDLRTMAALRDYDDVDRMIRDKIVFSASGKLQELVLQDTNLTLGIAIDIM